MPIEDTEQQQFCPVARITITQRAVHAGSRSTPLDVSLEAPGYFVVKEVEEERRSVLALEARDNIAVLIAIDDVFTRCASAFGKELSVTFQIATENMAEH